MSPFKSAELKVAAEELWGMGVRLNASAIASLFRTGELSGLLAMAIGIYNQIQYWKAQATLPAKRLEALKAELATFFRQRFDLENRLTAAQQNLPGLLADLARLDPDIARLQDSIRRLDAQIAAQEATIVSIGNRLSDLYRQRDQLKADIATVSAQITRLESEISRLEWDIRDAQRDVDYWSGRVRYWNGEIASIEAAMASYAPYSAPWLAALGRLQNAKNERDRAQTWLNSANARLSNLQRQLSAKKSSLYTAVSLRNTYQARLAALPIAATEAELATAENRLNSLLSDRRSLQGQLDSLQRTRTDLERSADALRAEIANVQRSLTTLADLIAKADADLATTAQALSDAQYKVWLLEQKMRTLGTGP